MPAGDAGSVLSHQTSNSGATRSIYSRGPNLSLDTFSSREFVVRDFVESLADGHLQTSNRRSGVSNQASAFDPKPFIRTFEHALARLGALGDERQAHENELTTIVRRAEGQHKQHCLTLQRKLDELLANFGSLEARLDPPPSASLLNGAEQEAGGQVALQIGSRLEDLDRQKRKAEDAKFLIQCWQAVSERGDLSQLEDVRKLGGSEGKIKCARIARQLLRISNGLHSQSQVQSKRSISINGNGAVNGSRLSSEQTRSAQDTDELIERFLEGLEKDMLEQFDESKRLHNDEGMRECATALYDFGEGSSVIGRFVNQHQFFLDRSHMVTEEVPGDRQTWDRLANPDAELHNVEPSLQALVDEVKLVLEEESFTIKQVFPYHELVLIRFLQRIFQQSIQQRLEMVLDKASSVSTLAFLRTLQSAKSYIGVMVEDIKAHGLTEHPDAVSPRVAATLDQQLEDLFIPYFAGSSYIERERRSLEELYASLLFKFTIYHSRRRKQPTSYLGSIGQRGRELLASARDTAIASLDSSELPASQKAVLFGIAGIRDTDNRDKSEIDVTERDGALSLATAKRMMSWLAEAVGRGLELSGGIEISRDIASLQRLLLAHMGDIYLETGLDAINEAAATQENAKSEPELSFLADLRTAIAILQMTVTVVRAILLPLVASNVATSREMEKSISTTVGRMEDKISNVTTHMIEVVLNWVSKLLARQNRADYKPRDEELGMDAFQTSTCSSIYAFMVTIRDQMSETLEGKNLETFSTELAVGFRTLLLDHFKKFQVNLAGGLMVSKDITKYIELLRTMPVAASFAPSLEVLVEIGNIFVIGPEALKDRLRGGGALTGIDKADLRPYILKRDDASSVGVQAVLNAI